MWLEQARQDFRFTVRSLINKPGFTVVAVLTLALGIGANSAVFAVINAVLLRPLPYRDPDRLVRIIENIPAAESPTGSAMRLDAMNPEDALELQKQTKALSRVGLYVTNTMILSGFGEARVAQVSQLSLATLPMLGIEPMLGRQFGPGEDKAGADNVVVLSYSAWLKYFAGDRNVLTRSVKLDDVSHVVIGVMPREFTFPDAKTEFWKPLVLSPAALGQIFVMPVMARVRGRISLSAASQEVNRIFRRLRGETRLSNPNRMELVQVKEAQGAVSRPALTVVAGAAFFVLLIACANISHLLLARTTSRGREIAVRVSLGAGRSRLVRQALAESLILALAGGAVGTVLGIAANQIVLPHWAGIVNSTVPALDHLSVDHSVLVFTLTVSLLAGLLFGLPPMFLVSRTDNLAAIREGTVCPASTSRFIGGNRALRLLVVTETGMAFALLAGALLLIHSFLKLSHVDPGFDTRNVLTFQVTSPPGIIRDGFNNELAEHLKSIAGIEAAGYGELLPLELDSLLIRPLRIPGVPEEAITSHGMPRTLEGSYDYFRSIGLRLLSGRWIQETDGPGRPQVMLINRAFARRFFGNINPVGKFVFSLGTTPWEIVGIVEDVRQRGLDAEPEPQFFLDYRQMPHAIPDYASSSNGRIYGSHVYFAVRTGSDSAALVPKIRHLIGELDSHSALTHVARLQDVLSDSIVTPEFYATLVGVFAGVAVALAGIGIYGVVAFGVTQRTREIGVRMAIGATRRKVLGLILREALTLAAVGTGLGIAGAAVTTRYLRNMLFELTPLDPASFVLSFLALAAVALLASYAPARRATRVDPVVALRYE